MKTVKALTKVRAVEDTSGHWYVIPSHLQSEFVIDDDNNVVDFDNKYRQYRTNGDLNNIQLWAEIEFQV